MDLSAEQFSDVIHAHAADLARSASDKRRRPRTGLQMQATLLPLCETPDHGPLTVQVRDLSSSGIGFLHSQKLSLDEQFALVLPREGDAPSLVLCEVAFWQPLARDLYAIGARFVRVLRDGGIVPLPVEIGPTLAHVADDVARVHRIAS